VSKSSGKIAVVHPLSGKRKKRASFDDLLLSGISIIADKGIDFANVSDVAALSGVSRPTFYTYFGDMNGFYAEVWLRYGREWLDSQVIAAEPVELQIDRALLEIFAICRRIPEVFEVVQPEFQRWWDEQTEGDAIRAQRLVWQLGFTLGHKISRPVTAKSDLGQPIANFLNLPDNAMDLPFAKGLGTVPAELLPPIAGLTLENDSVEASLTLAAKEVIAASGVAAASMTRIARRARVSTGTVYPRFKNADSLVRESFTQAVAKIVKGNVDIVAERGLGIDQYALTVNAGYGETRKVWRDFRTEMHIAAAHDSALAIFMESGFETATKFLEDSFIEFGLEAKLATPVAWFLHAHAIGLALIFVVQPSIADIDYRIMARYMISQLPSTPKVV
jgi:AcrR family transcriptional regulator